jgi:LacI family transcriptional regulator
VASKVIEIDVRVLTSAVTPRHPGLFPLRIRTTITDLARAAGVSTATVDRVLNDRAGVHARTRRRVLAVAQEIGYLDPEPTALTGALRQQIDLAFIVPGGTNTFLDALSRCLTEIGEQRAGETRVVVHRMEAFHPERLASGLRELAGTVDGVGLIALDHPAVRTAIREAVAIGTRILTLVSDISDVPRHGYVGIDNRAAGRLAGHLLGRFLRRARASVALFAGSLRYRGHEERASGFRRILAEEFPDLALLETREMHDDVEECYREASRLLAATVDLAGIYNVGGGNRGIVRALEDAGRVRDVVVIGHEVTEHTRRFLLSGAMDAVIDQNPRQEAEVAVDALLQAIRAGGHPLRIPPIRAQAIFRENLPEL